jgi:hypothetical protein
VQQAIRRGIEKRRTLIQEVRPLWLLRFICFVLFFERCKTIEAAMEIQGTAKTKGGFSRFRKMNEEISRIIG